VDYRKRTDEELIDLYREGDDGAVEFLMEKYKQLVRARARTLYLTGADKDDLLQEGMLGLFKAIRSFKKGEAAFPAFAALCISRQMYSAIRSSESLKNLPLAGFVSIFEMEEEQKSRNLSISDDPEQIILEKEAEARLKEQIFSILSHFERKVIELYLEGYDYKNISERLDKSPKSVDNAIQRTKKKVSEFCKEYETKY